MSKKIETYHENHIGSDLLFGLLTGGIGFLVNGTSGEYGVKITDEDGNIIKIPTKTEEEAKKLVIKIARD